MGGKQPPLVQSRVWVWKWESNGKNVECGSLHIQHRVRLGDNISLFNNKIKDEIIDYFSSLASPVLQTSYHVNQRTEFFKNASAERE